MAKYTMLLRTLLNDKDCYELIQEAMSTYPMYEAKNSFTYALIPTRSELNKKILNHFKYREIAFETPGRFIDELQITLEEIMPTYYSMYKSIDMMNEIDDIFGNIDITESYEEQGSGTSSGTSSTTSSEEAHSSTTNTNTTQGTSNNKHVASDTPQDELSITAKNIDSVTYASNVTWDKSEATSTDNATSEQEGTSSNTSAGSSESQSTTIVSHTLHKQGNQGVNTYAHDLVEFRSLFENVEQAIINDERLQELFMQIY